MNVCNARIFNYLFIKNTDQDQNHKKKIYYNMITEQLKSWWGYNGIRMLKLNRKADHDC